LHARRNDEQIKFREFLLLCSPEFVFLLAKSVTIEMYRTIILTVVLYGCKTWFLTGRAVCRWRVFKNRVLRGILGPEREEVTGVW
jgi:hypothetical protein